MSARRGGFSLRAAVGSRSKGRGYGGPVHPDEEARLAELRSLGLVGTPPEPRFDRYTALAADLFDVPIALVSLVEAEAQWYKSHRGMDLEESAREGSFCSHAIVEETAGFLQVEDAAADTRFQGSSVVVGPPYVRFYAGAVLHGPTGLPVGTLCVLDREPRKLLPRDVRRLRILAELVESELVRAKTLGRLQNELEVDQETGLPRRDRFTATVRQALSHRDGEVGVVRIDIEPIVRPFHLLGLGRAALGTLVGRIRGGLGEGESVARWSEAELVVLLTGKSVGRVLERTDAVLRALGAPVELGGHRVCRSPRAGIACAQATEGSPGPLLERAGMALHEAAGGRAVLFTSELAQGVRRRLQVEARLGEALERGGLKLVFQPKAAALDGRTVGAEALLRWTDPVLGPVRPDEFIPLAERSGQILAVDDWVLREAVATLGRWQRAGVPTVPIAVNLSVGTLVDPDLPERVQELLASEGVAPGLLQLEVTEHGLVEDFERAEDAMRRLDAQGVSFALDDFGTGYSSLAYLARMPVRYVKIDRSFVVKVDSDPTAAHLVGAIVTLARGLGMEVVAEGVEAVEQAAFLRGAGCSQLQGYFYARPLEVEAYEALMRQGGQLPRRGGGAGLVHAQGPPGSPHPR